MTEYYIRAEEIAKQLAVSQNKAYAIIRELNQELKDKGYLIVRGRVARRYYLERMGLIVDDEKEE